MNRCASTDAHAHAHNEPNGSNAPRKEANVVEGALAEDPATRLDRTSDTATLNAIAALLSGNEWSPETIENVADLVRASGRNISDHGDDDPSKTSAEEAEEAKPPPTLDDEAMSLIMNGALGSDDVEFLPTAPARGGDDGWWVDVRIWVRDHGEY